MPPFVSFFSVFFSFLPWLHRALSCSVLLLMRRPHMFVLRMFVTCEDFRLKSVPDIIFDVLKEFTSDSWEGLLHLSTSPVRQVGKVNPQLVGQGLGAVGTYEVSDALWSELAPVDFETSVLEFSLHRDVYSLTRDEMVLPMVRWLLTARVVSILDRNLPLRATCWPFIIPKTTEKVLLIFNLVDLNEGLKKAASFSLDRWEQILQKLAEWAADRPLFCTHVNLKTRSGVLHCHGGMRGAFRFRVRWEGEDRIFCMSRMPFRWKHSSLFC